MTTQRCMFPQQIWAHYTADRITDKPIDWLANKRIEFRPSFHPMAEQSIGIGIPTASGTPDKVLVPFASNNLKISKALYPKVLHKTRRLRTAKS